MVDEAIMTGFMQSPKMYIFHFLSFSRIHFREGTRTVRYPQTGLLPLGHG
jgi:hypothetical protein